MENNNDILLRVSNLCQYFKLGDRELKAVDNVSFEIKKGEVLGIVGESGCGKTTTGRAIIKLYNATSGDVYFKGQRIVAGIRSYVDAKKAARLQAKADISEVRTASLTPEQTKAKIEEIKDKLKVIIAEQNKKIKSANFDHKRSEKMYQKANIVKVKEKYIPLIASTTDTGKLTALKEEYKQELRIAQRDRIVTEIQMIFQDPIASLDPRMTVREIISEGLVIKGITDKKFINDEVNRMLEMVGLVSEHANRYPHEFSGGQRQRIGVARSVVMNPALIIADEPVSALDVSIQAQVINLLNDIRSKLGLTILFIAHDLSVVKYFSDRIGVMYYGKIVEMTSSDELFKNPLHPYTKSLLSAIPMPDPQYEKQRKRINYNPVIDHDYSIEKPILREIKPGHTILCNSVEFEKYRKEIRD